ncbi:MAG: DnaD domain protein [Chloroflexota bacterium]
MTEFSGFPDDTKYTSLPNVFFSSLLPEIQDIAELKVTLYIIPILHQKRGYPRYVTPDELLNNLSLRKCFKDTAELDKALDMAVKRGSLLKLRGNEPPQDFYFLNTKADRKAIEKIKRGELQLAGIKPYTISQPAPIEDIFTLYEDKMGKLLTPLIADWLKEADELYPRSWIADAIDEAVKVNKRNWQYVALILEHWQTEGKTDGAYQRYPKAPPDPDKYIRGKYGHIVQR